MPKRAKIPTKEVPWVLIKKIFIILKGIYAKKNNKD